MKIGIVCAGDDEVAPILSMMKIEKISHKAMLKFYEGKLENQNIVTLFSGVCKVNAAIAAQILIDTYGCDMIGKRVVLRRKNSRSIGYFQCSE